MTVPLVGVGLPMVGPHAGPEAIELVACAADRLGFHSVTVSDRLLLPAAPGWTNDFGLPEHPAYDAIEESVAAMRACWGPDPVEFEGVHYRIPRAKIGPKPVNGGIRVFAGGVMRPAIERAARIGDGLTLAFRSWDATLEQIDWYRAAGGTGPITVKGGPMLADAEHKTPPTTWTEPSMLDDLARLAETGVEEFAWDLNIAGGYEPERQVEILERLAADLGLPART